MKKEIVIASAIAGLLTSLSAGDNSAINIDKVRIDKVGKVLAPKDIQKAIRKKGNGDRASSVNSGCVFNNCRKKTAEKVAPIQKGVGIIKQPPMLKK